jgi:uncharacterized membrane protein HdeD (DUF308 family)
MKLNSFKVTKTSNQVIEDSLRGIFMTETSQSTTSRADAHLPPWWLVLLEGLAALIIGIYLIISPARTTLFLVQVLGWYWLIIGILTLVYLFMDRTDMIWKIASGILGIVAGLLILGYPMASAVLLPTSLILLVGILGICFGAVSLFWALKTGWGAAIMGVLSILFGLILLSSPYMGVVMLVYFLAALGIIGGLFTIYMAFKMRKM